MPDNETQTPSTTLFGPPLPPPLVRGAIRRQAELSQAQVAAELARRTGRRCDEAQVSRVERGVRTFREPLRSAYCRLLRDLERGQA